MGDTEAPSEPTPPGPNASETPKLAETGISEEAIRHGVSFEGLDPHDHEALKGIDRWQDIRLKRSYAWILISLVIAQLVAANAVFVAYAWAGMHWRLETDVIQVWLGATLVELIGLVLVITQYLFPRRDHRPRPAEPGP
jgi:sterol desaturase/sphingolipid hydroxylase (fatty acid hydroxylase superfamily)